MALGNSICSYKNISNFEIQNNENLLEIGFSTLFSKCGPQVNFDVSAKA